MALDQLGDRVRPPQHRHTMHLTALATQLVVDEADRKIGAQRVTQHVAHQHLPRTTGTDHQHPLPGRQTESMILEPAVEQTRAGKHQQLQPQIDHRHRAR